MDKLLNNQQAKSWGEWQSHTREYLIDSLQRSIIYTDILRKRGNNYIKHIRSGQPPVLVY